MVTPNCGTEPVELLAYFETGFPIAAGSRRRVHQAVPERHLEHPRGPVHEPHDADAAAALGRQPARPHPAAVDGRAGQGRPAHEPRPVRHRLRLGQVAGRACSPRTASPRTATARRAARLYAAGLNYSMTGVFYNKELAAQIGMTEPPETLAEFEALLAKAKDAGLQPIMQWNAAASGGGLAFPLQNLMAASARRSRSTTGSSRRRARPSTRRPTSRPPSTSSSGSRRVLPGGRQRHRVHRRERPLRQGRGRVHVQRRLAERRLRQGPAGQRRVLPVPAGRGGRHARRDVGAADLRHRRERQARRLRRVLPQLGRHRPDRAPDQRDRRRLEPGRPDRPADPDGRGGLGHQRDAGRRPAWSPQDNGAMDFIANATGHRSSPRAGRPSSRRWSAASRRPRACSRPSRPSTRRNLPSDRSRRSVA